MIITNTQDYNRCLNVVLCSAIQLTLVMPIRWCRVSQLVSELYSLFRIIWCRLNLTLTGPLWSYLTPRYDHISHPVMIIAHTPLWSYLTPRYDHISHPVMIISHTPLWSYLPPRYDHISHSVMIISNTPLWSYLTPRYDHISHPVMIISQTPLWSYLTPHYDHISHPVMIISHTPLWSYPTHYLFNFVMILTLFYLVHCYDFHLKSVILFLMYTFYLVINIVMKPNIVLSYGF